MNCYYYYYYYYYYSCSSISRSNDNYPVVPALQTIDYATFQSKYLANFEPTNIILFIQDAVSSQHWSCVCIE